MKAKRLIALALAAVFMLSAAATPVFAAAALPQENAALEKSKKRRRDLISILMNHCTFQYQIYVAIPIFYRNHTIAGFQCSGYSCFFYLHFPLLPVFPVGLPH